MLLSYRKRLVFAAIPLVLTVVWGAQEQSAENSRVAIRPEAPPSEDAGAKVNLRVDSNLVLIPVTVTDPRNRFVTGLDRDNFRIFEDKAEQRITQFSSEDAPVSGGVVFDCSGSMGGKLAKSREAVAQFFRTANPEDEFFLIQFNDGVKVVQPFTGRLAEVQNSLAFTSSKGRTALLDAVYLSLQQMKQARNPRKAVLIISDGGDNSSRYTETEIKNLVKETNMQIYAMGIYEQGETRSRTPEEMNGPALLTEIADQTGGRQYAVDNVGDLPDIAAKIGTELRNQYILGYAPLNGHRDGKFRHVQVVVSPPRGLPPLRAAWRQGYYAPSQ